MPIFVQKFAVVTLAISGRTGPILIIFAYDVATISPLNIMGKHSVIHKTGSITHCNAVTEGPNRSMSNIYRKFGDVWTSGFGDMLMNRLTNTYTDKLVINRSI